MWEGELKRELKSGRERREVFSSVKMLSSLDGNSPQLISLVFKYPPCCGWSLVQIDSWPCT